MKSIVECVMPFNHIGVWVCLKIFARLVYFIFLIHLRRIRDLLMSSLKSPPIML